MWQAVVSVLKAISVSHVISGRNQGVVHSDVVRALHSDWSSKNMAAVTLLQ